MKNNENEENNNSSLLENYQTPNFYLKEEKNEKLKQNFYNFDKIVENSNKKRVERNLMKKLNEISEEIKKKYNFPNSFNYGNLLEKSNCINKENETCLKKKKDIRKNLIKKYELEFLNNEMEKENDAKNFKDLFSAVENLYDSFTKKGTSIMDRIDKNLERKNKDLQKSNFSNLINEEFDKKIQDKIKNCKLNENNTKEMKIKPTELNENCNKKLKEYIKEEKINICQIYENKDKNFESNNKEKIEKNLKNNNVKMGKKLLKIENKEISNFVYQGQNNENNKNCSFDNVISFQDYLKLKNTDI